MATVEPAAQANTTPEPSPSTAPDAAPPATTTAAAPDSPPTPARPTALTPGVRASRLQHAYTMALRATLARLDYDNFAACYPTIAAAAPTTLQAVQRQMVDRLNALCMKEFDAIMASREVVPKLNELETLLSEAASRRETSDASEPPTPPHLLPPTTILRAHLGPHLTAHQSQLNARLQTTQSHNAQLSQEILQQRAEIESLLAAAEGIVSDLDAANEALDEVGDEVAAESRKADLEMEKRL